MNLDQDLEAPHATFSDPTLPSSTYSAGFSSERSLYDMLNCSLPPWGLEELGYKYDATHVPPDDQIEDGLHPPEYYTYNSDLCDWQEGLQEIDNFDWRSEKSENGLFDKQANETQGSSEVPDPEAIITPTATISDNSSVCDDEALAQIQLVLSRITIREKVQNSDGVSPVPKDTPLPSTFDAETLHTPPTSPSWTPEPSQPNQTYPDTPTPAISNAPGDTVEIETEDAKPLDGVVIGKPSHITEVKDSGTSLEGQDDTTTQQQEKDEKFDEVQVLEDDRSTGGEANGVNLEDNRNETADLQVSSTSDSAGFYEALLLLATTSQQQLSEKPKARPVSELQVALEVPAHAHIEYETSKSSGLDAKDSSAVQSDPEKEQNGKPEIQFSVEREDTSNNAPLPSQETKQVVSRESNGDVGSSKNAASPVANSLEPSREDFTLRPLPECLVRVEDGVSEQWQTQLPDAANSPSGPSTQDSHGHDGSHNAGPHTIKSYDTEMQEGPAESEHLHNSTATLRPFPLQLDKNENDEQHNEHPPIGFTTGQDEELNLPTADETSSELSDAPSHIAEAMYGISLADNDASVQLSQPSPTTTSSPVDSCVHLELTKRAESITSTPSNPESRKKVNSNISGSDQDYADNEHSTIAHVSTTIASLNQRKARKPIARKLFTSNTQSSSSHDNTARGLEDSPAVPLPTFPSSTQSALPLSAQTETPESEAQNGLADPFPNEKKNKKRKVTTDEDEDFKLADNESESESGYYSSTAATAKGVENAGAKRRKINTKPTLPKTRSGMALNVGGDGGMTITTATTNKYGFTVRRGGGGRKKVVGGAEAGAGSTRKRGAGK